MDLSTISFLAKYNKTVNEKMNSYISVLDDKTWTRNFGGYFPSIKSLCNHLYTCDTNWLKRFSKLRKFTFTEGTKIPEGLSFTVDNIADISNYLNKREILDNKIIEFASELKEEELAMNLTYIDSHGVEYAKNMGFLILHMFNHQTHHRGMISLYLDELKIENDLSNIYDIL